MNRKQLIERARLEKAKREKAKRDLFAYIKYTFKKYEHENWHHRLISSFIQKGIEREITRCMIWLPPRHMKTESMQRGFSYALGHDHDLKLMLTAYGADKAYKISSQVKTNINDNSFNTSCYS